MIINKEILKLFLKENPEIKKEFKELIKGD